jgi:hypothetical protein
LGTESVTFDGNIQVSYDVPDKSKRVSTPVAVLENGIQEGGGRDGGARLNFVQCPLMMLDMT